MNNYENYLIILLYTIILNLFFIKLNLFKDKKKFFKHKNFTQDKSTPPFSGGIIFLLTLIIFIPNINYELKIFLSIIFLIGFFSDLNILKSPNLRFLFQLITVIFFVIFSNIFVESVRINFIDQLLENYIFNLFFTSFCILVLINGSNFIDGVNTLAIGYYFLVLFFISSIFFELNFTSINLNINLLNWLLFSLGSLFILNLFNKLYLGDNGAYLISVFIGIILIYITNNNVLVSPYYIINLLWYPAYENLFSIIRKVINNKSAFKPDNFHLHQLIFIFLKNNIKNSKIINSFTGCIINLFNFIIFFLATMDYSNTKYQLIIISFSLLTYNFLYIVLKNYVKKINYIK